jgi:uncharacterized membrane protein
MSRSLGIAFVAALTLVAVPLGAAVPAGVAEKIEEIEVIEVIEEVDVVPAGEGGPGAAAGGGGAGEQRMSLAEVAARMHPALVHLPIAWLLLLLLLDLLGVGLGREPFRAVGPWVGVLTALSFLPAAVTGLLRQNYPPYDRIADPLLLTHRNLMLTVAGVTLAAVGLRLARRNRLGGAWRWAYLALVAGAAALVTIAGHLGGKLVFGENYLPF